MLGKSVLPEKESPHRFGAPSPNLLGGSETGWPRPLDWQPLLAGAMAHCRSNDAQKASTVIMVIIIDIRSRICTESVFL